MRKITACLIIALLILNLQFINIHATSCSAGSAIVTDMNSGRILYQKNIDVKLPIASTTKILTGIIALENGNSEDVIEISPEVAGVEGSSMYLKAGEHITLENLVYGLMLQSGNDAAAAIARHIAGDEQKFAELMNQKAAEIGAADSHFANPHGLPNDEHYSTARDMAKITAYALNNPSFAKIVSTQQISLPQEGLDYNRVLTNHNKLLKMYDGCIGVKTGFTKVAGRCLVTAAKRDNLTLVCVTLNDPNDWSDHTALYDEAFASYHAEPAVKAGEEIGDVKISGGSPNKVGLTVENDCYIPVKDGEDYQLVVKTNEDLKAPLLKGAAAGEAEVVIDGEVCGEIGLCIAENVNTSRVDFKPHGVPLGFAVWKVYMHWLTMFTE